MDQNNKEQAIRAAVHGSCGAQVTELRVAGKGANGSVYCVTLDKEPFRMAVKEAENFALLEEEYRYIGFISERVEMKLPKLYFLHRATTELPVNLLGMQYFEGVSAENPRFRWKSKRKKQFFANQVAENLERLQRVTNDKFGPIGDPVYDSWHEYYKPLAKRILDAAQAAFDQGNFVPEVLGVMRTAYERYDEIFCEPVGAPVLTHGDYWTPNILVKEDTLELIGVVDPFNVMWADRDYELFAMTVGMGKRFRLYETYKERMGISDRCDLKNEFYALFSEVLWFTRTGHKLDGFLKFKAKLLKKEMKRFGVI